jgi:hypothetical protein
MEGDENVPYDPERPANCLEAQSDTEGSRPLTSLICLSDTGHAQILTMQ